MTTQPDMTDLMGQLSTPEGSPDAVALLQSTVKEFGGVDGVAREIHAEYAFLEQGSNSRSKILLTLFQAILNFGTGESGVINDPETLKATLKQQLDKLDND